MSRVPLKYEGEVVGWAEVEDGNVVTGQVTNLAFARYLNESTLQYISIGPSDAVIFSTEDKNDSE